MLHIKAWKDLLPEPGSLFRDGVSKWRIARHDRADLERFARETRRAERTHWAILALSPVFYAWNPGWLPTVMLAFGVLANVPCLLSATTAPASSGRFGVASSVPVSRTRR